MLVVIQEVRRVSPAGAAGEEGARGQDVGRDDADVLLEDGEDLGAESVEGVDAEAAYLGCFVGAGCG